MSASPAISNSFATDLPELAFSHSGAKFPSARIVVLNDALAHALGIDPAWLQSDEGIAFLTGHSPEGVPSPVAMAYAGHQFGGYSPVLGDGRALLLGEVEGPVGLTGLADQHDTTEQTQTYDLHAKGTGPTSFSRGGDGKATLSAALREYLISEALYAQGVPTTRALAVIATGEQIQLPVQPAFTVAPAQTSAPQPQGTQASTSQTQGTQLSAPQSQTPQPPAPQPPVQPGGIIVRVASSHLRVGTFQLVAHSAQNSAPLLDRLLDFASRRHHIPFGALHSGKRPAGERPAGERPAGISQATASNTPSQASNAAAEIDVPLSEKARDLLRSVVKRQAELVSQWLAAGFVHGVMNTDNCTISGETIDYGPCAFLDAHDPNAVFSSIDAQGRYRYGAQPTMAAWNLARLAEALLPILSEDPEQAFSDAQNIISEFATDFGDALTRHWLPKLGLSSSLADGQLTPDATALVRDWQKLLGEFSPDHTNVHRALIAAVRGDFAPVEAEFAHAEFAHADAGHHGNNNDALPKLRQWLDTWAALRAQAQINDDEAVALMEHANPVYIPRNHLVAKALAEATNPATAGTAASSFATAGTTVENPAATGEDALNGFEFYTELLDAVTHPDGNSHAFPPEFTRPAPSTFGQFTSYCGT